VARQAAGKLLHEPKGHSGIHADGSGSWRRNWARCFEPVARARFHRSCMERRDIRGQDSLERGHSQHIWICAIPGLLHPRRQRLPRGQRISVQPVGVHLGGCHFWQSTERLVSGAVRVSQRELHDGHQEQDHKCDNRNIHTWSSRQMTRRCKLRLASNLPTLAAWRREGRQGNCKTQNRT